MKTQWLGKSVDLDVLCKCVEPFFRRMGFRTTVEKIQEGFEIRADSEIPGVQLELYVVITGQPDDFTVEFFSGSQRGALSSSVAGHLTWMFGGEYILSKEARKSEVLNLLESRFWKHVQIQVANLADSATDTKKRSRNSTS